MNKLLELSYILEKNDIVVSSFLRKKKFNYIIDINKTPIEIIPNENEYLVPDIAKTNSKESIFFLHEKVKNLNMSDKKNKFVKLLDAALLYVKDQKLNAETERLIVLKNFIENTNNFNFNFPKKTTKKKNNFKVELKDEEFLIAFKVNGELLDTNKNLQNWWIQYQQKDKKQVIDCLTGEYGESIDKYPCIKFGKNYCKLIAYDKASYWHYGKKKNNVCVFTYDTASRLATTINYLAKTEEHCYNIDECTYLVWTDSNQEEILEFMRWELESNEDTDNQNQSKKVINKLADKDKKEICDGEYHILCLSGNKMRLIIKGYEHGNKQILLDNIESFKKDFSFNNYCLRVRTLNQIIKSMGGRQPLYMNAWDSFVHHKHIHIDIARAVLYKVMMFVVTNKKLEKEKKYNIKDLLCVLNGYISRINANYMESNSYKLGQLIRYHTIIQKKDYNKKTYSETIFRKFMDYPNNLLSSIERNTNYFKKYYHINTLQKLEKNIEVIPQSLTFNEKVEFILGYFNTSKELNEEIPEEINKKQ